MRRNRSAIVRVTFGQLLLAAGLLARATPTPAQERPSSYPLWTIDTLTSQVLGETRTIFVALPSDYNRAARANERFPVLIVLDAEDDEYLAAYVTNARFLGGSATPAIPPLIVVGIQTTKRNRDFSPPGISGSADYGGDAPNFARFLETELLPSIRARYRTLPFTIIAGHSMSGLFVAYAYGQSPGFVNAVIAISPSLLWEDGKAVQLVAEGMRGRTASGRFFVGTGTTEWELDGAATRLAEEMSAHPARSTAFTHHHLVGDTHYTSPLQGAIDGLRFVFEPVQLSDRPPALVHRESAVAWGNGALLASSEDELAAYRDIRNKFAEGARELGLPERLPPYFGGGLGLWLASSNRVAAAKVICQDVIESHPDNWLGYDCLGNALRAAHDSSGAAASYRAAIAIVEQAGDAAALARLRRGLQAVVPQAPQE